jgi:hypothetical protein
MPNPNKGHVVTVAGQPVNTGSGSASTQSSGVSGSNGFARLTAIGGLVTAISPPNIAVQSAAYSLLPSDDGAIGNTNASSFTLTLPLAASQVAGVVLPFAVQMTYGAGNSLTLAAVGSDKINGASSLALAAPFDGLVLVSDGISNWYVVARSYGDSAANLVVATPNGSHGVPVVRALVLADMPAGVQTYIDSFTATGPNYACTPLTHTPTKIVYVAQSRNLLEPTTDYTTNGPPITAVTVIGSFNNSVIQICYNF